MAESTFSVCFATLGKGGAWSKLLSTEDHAWVVIVLEMTVVNVNTTRRRLFALDISKNLNRGEAVFH